MFMGLLIQLYELFMKQTSSVLWPGIQRSNEFEFAIPMALKR